MPPAEVDLVPRSPYNKSILSASYSVWREYFGYVLLGCLFVIFCQWKGDAFWSWVLLSCSRPTAVYFVTFAVPTIVYWIAGGFFCLLDWRRNPEVCAAWKLQPNRFCLMSDYWKATKQALFNQFVVSLPFGILFMCLWEAVGGSFEAAIPSKTVLVWNFIVIGVLVEIFFYYAHRFMHWNRIYRYIHKKHHEFTTPIAIAAIYAHPVEYLLANMLPVFVGPIVLRSHLLVVWFWLGVTHWNTINSHCGYHLPGFPSPLYHDYHHFKFTNNFGLFGVLDALHKTNVSYSEFMSFVERNNSKSKNK